MADINDNRQLKFNVQDDGILDITEDNLTVDIMTGDALYDGLVPPFIWLDPNIFTNDVRALYVEMPKEERANFLIEVLDKFYRNNIEYSNFARVQIYKEPLILLEFFHFNSNSTASMLVQASIISP